MASNNAWAMETPTPLPPCSLVPVGEGPIHPQLVGATGAAIDRPLVALMDGASRRGRR